MRCAACNKVLSDSELTTRLPESGEFADLCNTCYDSAFDTNLSDVLDFGIEVELESYNED
jgi:hypothetical protein